MNRCSRLVWAFALVCAACSSGDDDNSKDASTPDSGVDAGAPKKSADVRGRVIDSAGTPLADVAIHLAGKSAMSGSDGTFALGMVPEGMQQALLAEREGYSTGHVRVDVLGAAESQQITLTLQASETAMLQDANQGGMAATPSGTQIEFPAGAFVDMNGKPVSGAVKVEVALVNDRDEIGAGPGGMIALAPQGTQGEETPLESFGMVEVKLSAAGEPVQLKNGVEVDLLFPLARNHGFKDGDPIALWHFDEAENHWVMRGEGIVEGDSFRAKVDHFSWWNADQVLTRACVRGRLLNAAGEPVGGAQLLGEGRSYLGTSAATTDMSGSFCMLARVSSLIELGTTFRAAGKSQALAVGVNTPRAAGDCGNPSSCLMLGDVKAVADEPMCNPAQCPADGDRVPCCRTSIGPCDFMVNGDCGGSADGSWDTPGEPGMTPIDGVPMNMPMNDAGKGGAGGMSEAGAGGMSGSAGSTSDDGKSGSGGAGKGAAGSGGAGTGASGMGGGSGQGSGGAGTGAGTGGSAGSIGNVDRCGNVTPASIGLTQGTTVGSSLLNDWWDGGSCYVNAPGFERMYSISVPAHGQLRARAMGQRARVVISTECDAPVSSCVNAGIEVGWQNNSSSAVTAYVTVDSLDIDAMSTFTLALALGSTDVCGDGIRGNKPCDDGNTSDGDGCSSTCQVESSWDCPSDSKCTQIVCGDGVVFARPLKGGSQEYDDDGCPYWPTKYETCDDGNTTPGDGCSASCQSEQGYACVGAPSVCSLRSAGAVCSLPLALATGTYDFATLDDVIDFGSNGGRELFFEQPLQPGNVLHVAGHSELDATVYFFETNACDGTSGTSRREYLTGGQSFLIAYKRDYYTNSTENTAVTLVFEADEPDEQGDLVITSAGTHAPGCGDGLLDPDERCDDGNDTAADGCSASCEVEVGHVCPRNQPCRLAVCGNAVIDWPVETCDDGNTAEGDGCSANCTETPGQLCDFSVSPASCVSKSAGDLCNNAVSVSELAGQPYSIDGFSHDERAADACAAPDAYCPPTRWFSFTQAPGEVTTVYVGDASFEGAINLETDACPPQYIATGNGPSDGGSDIPGSSWSSFGPSHEGLVSTRNFGSSPRTVYFMIRSEQGATGNFELTVHTGAAGCGDGITDGDLEECDDMNTQSGDGCSTTCTQESGPYQCPYEGGPCTHAQCGDGAVFHGGSPYAEACDDGNTTNGDGCSDSCEIEDGYVCAEEDLTSKCSLAGAGELCSTAVALPLGSSMQSIASCAPACNGQRNRWWTTTLESGALLSIELSSSTAELSASLFALGSAGCKAPEQVDSTWVWSSTTELSYRNPTPAPITLLLELEDVGDSSTEVELTVSKQPLASCGDGVLSIDESCDDENTGSGDGCSTGCVVEDGYACSGEPSDCVAALAGELCNNASLLTSSPATFSLSGYGGEESPEPSRWLKVQVPAKHALIGSVATSDISYGIVRFYDVSTHLGCVDRSQEDYSPFGASFPFSGSFANSYDGPVWLAIEVADATENPSTGSFEVSYAIKPLGCGDGIFQGGNAEQCDDGNTSSNDGCSPTCQIEPGFACNGSQCTPIVCGDGVRLSDEECDDGDTQSGDGCSSSCTIEQNYSCTRYGGSGSCVLRPAGDICSNAFALAPGSWNLSQWNRDYDLGSGPDMAFSAVVQAGQMLTLQGSASFGAQVQLFRKDELCALGSDAQPLGSRYFPGGDPIGFQADSETLHAQSATVEIVIVIAASSGVGTFSWSDVQIAAPSCGDGIVMSSSDEQCDDGNTTNGDGCNALCLTEVGYLCRDGKDCHLIACGDGRIDRHSDSCAANETCDDQGNTSGDGCSASCTVEPGYRCTGEPSVCVEIPVGDDCSSATTLSDGQYSLEGFTPDPDCNLTCGAADRWLKISIPAGSTLTVDLQSSQDYPASPYARLFDITNGCGDGYPLDTQYVPFGENVQLVYENQEPNAITVALALMDQAQGTSDLAFSLSYDIAP